LKIIYFGFRDEDGNVTDVKKTGLRVNKKQFQHINQPEATIS
jgi:hypothetical protein